MRNLQKIQILPSATVAINSRAAQKKLLGEPIYNFAAGDPVLPNHEAIVLAGIRAVQNKYAPYPPVAGLPRLRELAAAWMNATWDTSYRSENVLITCGGKFGLYAAMQALLQPGEEVLMISPYWVSYPEIVKLFDGKPRIISTTPEQGWKISPSDIEQNATSATSLLILNNGSNPTGILYTREELREILEVARKMKLNVIADEVYSGLVYDASPYVSCGSFPEYQDRVIVIQSCSKNFGMTGWRVGLIFGNKEIIRVLTLLQGQSTTGTSIISQQAAIGALEQAKEVNAYILQAMKKRRDIFMHSYRRLFSTKVETPSSSLYLFAPLTDFGVKNENSLAFCERVLDSANVALVPGRAFGRDDYVRFAFSEEEAVIEKGLEALHQALRMGMPK